MEDLLSIFVLTDDQCVRLPCLDPIFGAIPVGDDFGIKFYQYWAWSSQTLLGGNETGKLTTDTRSG